MDSQDLERYTRYLLLLIRSQTLSLKVSRTILMSSDLEFRRWDIEALEGFIERTSVAEVGVKQDSSNTKTSETALQLFTSTLQADKVLGVQKGESDVRDRF